MVYIILNGLLCVFLIAYSYAVDRNKMIEFGMTVNSILFLFSYTLTVFLNLLLIECIPIAAAVPRMVEKMADSTAIIRELRRSGSRTPSLKSSE